jgi:hypothetical protein
MSRVIADLVIYVGLPGAVYLVYQATRLLDWLTQ